MQIIDSKWNMGVKQLTKRKKYNKCVSGFSKRKLKANSNISRYKVRLMAIGYSQVHELDYYETFFPIMKIALIRILLALATNKNYEIHQMDVKTQDQFFEQVSSDRNTHGVAKRIYQT
jgi:hypothetical protein